MTETPYRPPGSGLGRRRWLVGGALLLLAVALIWLTQRDIRSGQRMTNRLMTAYGRSLAAVIAEAETHGREAYRGWEEALARRLLDNAHWIAALDSLAPDASPLLWERTRSHQLHRVHLFRPGGAHEMYGSGRGPWNPAPPGDSAQGPRLGQGPRWGGGPGGGPRGQRRGPGPSGRSGAFAGDDQREAVEPLFAGERDSLILGLRAGRYQAASRYTAGVRTPDGTVVLVTVDADSLAGTLQAIAPAHLLESLAAIPGIRYVRIESGDSLLAGSPAGWEVPPLRRDADDAAWPAAPRPRVRSLEVDGMPIIEVAQLVPGGEIAGVTLRVGLDGALLRQIDGAMVRRAWVRLLVFLFAATLAALLLAAWQRHQMMAHEIHQIRLELEAREAEAIRTEKTAAMGSLASGVAHKIRNPLNTIHMLAQQLERDSGLDAQIRRQLGHVRSESRRIEGIVQQFLQLARPEPPRWQQLDVAGVARETARIHRPSFQAARIGLEVEAKTAPGRTDREFIIEIIENLLRNAREAVGTGGHVRLAVRPLGREIEILVDDDGPGVPPNLRERIFDLYYTTKPSGSGIGLGEVARMAATLGGGVRVEDSPEGGARFRVRLRRDPVAPHPGGEDESTPRSQTDERS